MEGIFAFLLFVPWLFGLKVQPDARQRNAMSAPLTGDRNGRSGFFFVFLLPFSNVVASKCRWFLSVGTAPGVSSFTGLERIDAFRNAPTSM